MRSSLVKSVVEWFRATAVRTGAYRIVKVEEIANTTRGSVRNSYDLAIQLVPTNGGRQIRLLIEAKERVSPLMAIGILERMAGSRAKGIPTLCSRIISERVAELCRTKGVSYLDEAGNCWLSAPGFFLQVEGKKPVRSMKQPQVDPFAIKSSRIVRVLLGSPKRGWQVQELADEAQVSLGLVAKVKQALLEQAFVEERERLVYLRDPKGLLEAWAANYKVIGERVSLYVMQKTNEAERTIAHWCSDNKVGYALTKLAGAWQLAPSVRYNQSTVIVESKKGFDVVNELVQKLKAKQVDSGSNLVLVVPEDSFVLYQSHKIHNIQVASPVQVYLDLCKQPGRSEEAAQEILKREIMPTW